MVDWSFLLQVAPRLARRHSFLQLRQPVLRPRGTSTQLLVSTLGRTKPPLRSFFTTAKTFFEGSTILPRCS